MTRNHTAEWGTAAALSIGLALLLMWPGDIEWKGDERWSFEHAVTMADGGAWPHVGMPTSLGPPNPGLSVWSFGALAWLTGARTPPDLARAVHFWNCAGLLAMACFIRREIARADREPWYWALGLMAVNPVLVIIERKIWPPALLPPLTIALFWSWWRRERSAGAFAWGLVGAALGQIHVPAMLFSLSIAAWTTITARRSVDWRWWSAGSILGLLPLVPWALAVGGELGEAGPWHHWPNATLYLRWITQAIGSDSHYTLGFTVWSPHFIAYLRGPTMAGEDTYVMGLVHVVMLVAAVIVTVQLAIALRRARTSWGQLLLGNPHDGTMWIAAAWWGYLGTLMLAGIDVHRHYLVVATLPMALSTAYVVFAATATAARARWILLTLFLAQTIASAGLLRYIHVTQVIEPAEFGPTWAIQQHGVTTPR